ncbi:hypothetical protein BA022_12105 [Diaphorobacter nitroreducens]|uniref:hypothetical protein n=1 Tax=Diaphorobacter nitroreducens TaxID=164759 RepID=UPI000B59E4D5|nr:hypothetical protein [Diaphorobacter nitroreducens]ASI69208.1 hypothetical protein BA022_12105 [Diaphorobacter nitroreducens]
MKLTKVAFAVASALAVVAGSAHAGQIDASSTTLATEVIYANTQVVRAPSKSYTFAGAVDARNNEQRLQLQWKLSGTTLQWALGQAAGGDVNFGADGQTLVSLPAAQTLLRVSGTDGANAAIGWNGVAIGALTGFQVQAFLADAQTLVFNITIPQSATNLINNAVFTINGSDFAGAATPANVGVTNVAAVAGQTACVAPSTSTDIEFKHYTTHNGNRDLMTGVVSDSEHLRPAASNVGRYLNFTQNLRFNFTSGVQSQVDAANLRTLFVRTAAETADYAAAVATLGVPATRLHRIATAIDLSKVAAGLDLNYTNQYGLASGAAGDFLAADFAVGSAGILNTGVIETVAAAAAPGPLVIRVASPLGAAGVAPGSTVALLTAGDAAIPGTVTAFDANGVATITLTSAADIVAATTGAGAKLYYVVNGVGQIPQNAQFNVTASLNKNTAGDLREQNNVCAADLAGVGGGIKIDVRNYATYAKFGDTGASTTVRLINNSETQAADVFAQIIYADGTYGAWGKLADLKPREVVNLTNKQIEALLVNAAAATNPFGNGATQYASTGGSAVVGNIKAGMSDRLRIVSNSGTTLRVQSYMVVGNSVIDTSNAQGVDFESTTNNRVPTTAIDAQPVSQDAINGLSR